MIVEGEREVVVGLGRDAAEMTGMTTAVNCSTDSRFSGSSGTLEKKH